ncbi:MAG: nucleotidyltransferase domain-containing protein [Candidatus Pacearchaeota archaeon]|jgi:predicted nucleotidyltransferase
MRKLNTDIILKKIEKEKAKLKKKGVKKIGLFGSYAKDSQKKDSDIDFLIEFKKIDFDRYLYILNLLEKIFKKKIDLVIESDLKPELKYVKKEAKYVRI